MLGYSGAEFVAGDEQHPLDAGQRAVERLGIVVARRAHLHALFGQIGHPLRVTHDRDDRRDARAEQGLDDETAQVPAGTGDGNGHDLPPEIRTSC
ncbi:hypothetical protein O3I_039475 [Nocardia brasiliensis ATCC 700358]|uniref:Uncharacterized protein n=1 Tax=Nocardia brasiliensis (strain ATCC 700358 / HUJEG-1) TaxID=1133849 RepID=K0F807_NOCB7|nr:hypothetical protein O3I_039475 [Nocardia brasiliensis ATCC 700358]